MDLPYVSTDGKNYIKMANDFKINAESYSISACNDDQLAGEDISKYGGWGGKLVSFFLDYVVASQNNFNVIKLYLKIKNAFRNQSLQATEPVLSSTRHNL
uniref:Uncharacterized protein n=1 Tax=Pithovirus LCDPAC01 TaxID=2506600 RepID=A0A481YNY5_9VIRU|nr:MAG: hypothetical protein LCDPAC01_01450 [Pithovirus LCDPAC01]